MESKEKFGAAHKALLLLTVAFLASLVWLTLRGGTRVEEKDGYAVTVERSVPAERIAAEPVDINAATAEELETLPGIGPVLARRIVDYRAEHGAFASAEELLGVDGIGQAKLDGIRGSITLGQEEAP